MNFYLISAWNKKQNNKISELEAEIAYLKLKHKLQGGRVVKQKLDQFVSNSND